MKLKTEADIKILREGGRHLATVLHEVARLVEPGVTTSALDAKARELIAQFGDTPAFLGYQPHGAAIPYPAALCVSVNDEIVHGVPSDYVLQEGDIVSLDLGINHGGLITDSAITVPVGKIEPEAQALIDRTKEALDRAILAAQVGNTVGDIGHAVETFIKPFRYGVIEDLAGHGVGFEVHEDPQVPNTGKPGTGQKLVSGLVIAIEPMITLGGIDIDLLDDEYTLATADGSLAAHFEHTIAITEAGPVVLTAL